MEFRGEINNNIEVWKRITVYSKYGCSNYSKYEVSNFGNVRNNRGKVLINRLEKKTGFLFVSILKDEYPLGFRNYIHDLVANAFVERPPDGEAVLHIDHNRTNNCASNLKWRSPSEFKKLCSSGLLVISDSDTDED